MNQVNETKLTEVTEEDRKDLQEKAEASEVMKAVIFVGGTTMATALLLVAVGHSLPEIVKSSNRLKEIIVVETAKNTRQGIRLSFLSQAANGVLSKIPNVLRTQTVSHVLMG